MTKREYVEDALGVVADTAINFEEKIEDILDLFEDGEINAEEAAKCATDIIFRAQQVFYAAIDCFVEKKLITSDEADIIEDIAMKEAEDVVAANDQYTEFIKSLLPKDCDAKIFVVDSYNI